ncbi:hypothetical protein A9798_15370 [Edwardsiella hoshinae]|uniref:Uncharacterized protein n=1 Tax=Edwardsiella hoshinae TaxID=93378 RepID=A0ABM6EKG9_9GAMM|nr:hypothetical protein [Edwardsiella hoshinae]AOV95545.1 hypothetical protein A9798_00365 [Edwardsiella hoshinae]AOV96149.1 hypothetical protein A9798_03750 [Edwardsiella hoshinae]AOV97082.1 hypothetical protein A9798_08965 [Edwardsiella hoshinae]AOV97497.1 hypothetical protein A9798_11410 [Edwardsiella hoshinae]AOV97678.1 hypothetical protein A9798_12455 [Edwardsiella hoshinae]
MERFILSGTCFYELNGLRYLLQEAGYPVFDEVAVKTFGPDDVFVLALSAEPLLGWGRHVRYIRHCRRRLPCRMVVLVPPSLGTLRVFDGTCPVISGHLPRAELISQLLTLCRDALALPREPQSPFRLLNVKQGGSRRQLLQQYRENTPLRRMAKSDYYHRGRLLDVLGIEKMQTLSIVGQELLS